MLSSGEVRADSLATLGALLLSETYDTTQVGLALGERSDWVVRSATGGVGQLRSQLGHA